MIIWKKNKTDSRGKRKRKKKLWRISSQQSLFLRCFTHLEYHSPYLSVQRSPGFKVNTEKQRETLDPGLYWTLRIVYESQRFWAHDFHCALVMLNNCQICHYRSVTRRGTVRNTSRFLLLASSNDELVERIHLNTVIMDDDSSYLELHIH